MVWVDSRWVCHRDEWLEARSTAPGLLDDLPLSWGTPPPGATKHVKIFSLVVDDPSAKVRRLPSLYHANAQIYAHRDVEVVRSRLVSLVRTVLDADARASYLITACKVGETFGLYTRDAFNRNPFRVAARRAGIVFADEPHVEMTPGGGFRTETWGEFEPRFVIASDITTADGKRDANRGAHLAFLFGVLRVGDMTAVELHHATNLVRFAEVLTEPDPGLLVDRIRAIPAA